MESLPGSLPFSFLVSDYNHRSLSLSSAFATVRSISSDGIRASETFGQSLEIAIIEKPAVGTVIGQAVENLGEGDPRTKNTSLHA